MARVTKKLEEKEEKNETTAAVDGDEKNPSSEKENKVDDKVSDDTRTGEIVAEELGFTFKVKKAVTAPQLKLKVGDTVYVKFLAPIFQSKEHKSEEEIAKLKEANKYQVPPLLCRVLNLKTKKEQEIIMYHILNLELGDNYPDESYVNKCFQITMGKPDKEKARYKTFEITEIELD